MPKFTAWVVVCSDHHHAVGPFMVELTALNVAKQLTSKGGCVYLPVPLELEAQVIEEPKKLEPKRIDDRRGYL